MSPQALLLPTVSHQLRESVVESIFAYYRKVIAELPEDWKKLWHTMVPAQRFCDPYELKGVCRVTPLPGFWERRGIDL